MIIHLTPQEVTKIITDHVKDQILTDANIRISFTKENKGYSVDAVVTPIIDKTPLTLRP